MAKRSYLPYSGERFTKNQLSFIVAVMIHSAWEIIETEVTAHYGDKAGFEKRRKSGDWNTWVQAAEEHLGWNLSILFAQLSDDGMSVGDALELVGWDDHIPQAVDKLIAFKPPKSGGFNLPQPSIKKMVDTFVEKAFIEQDGYLSRGWKPRSILHPKEKGKR